MAAPFLSVRCVCVCGVELFFLVNPGGRGYCGGVCLCRGWSLWSDMISRFVCSWLGGWSSSVRLSSGPLLPPSLSSLRRGCLCSFPSVSVCVVHCGWAAGSVLPAFAPVGHRFSPGGLVAPYRLRRVLASPVLGRYLYLPAAPATSSPGARLGGRLCVLPGPRLFLHVSCPLFSGFSAGYRASVGGGHGVGT